MAREPGLDAARTLATLFVIATHAALSFMVTPIGWAIQDRSQFIGVDVYVWIARAFGMPTFFWLSGYSARSLLVRRGTGGYLHNRLTRVLVPLAIALVPCSLALDHLWDWGREVGQRAAVADHIPKLQGSELPIELGHLWYLYYLLWMSAAALVIARALRGVKIPAGAGVLAVPAALSIGVLGYVGAVQTDTPLGFAPDLPILVYMGGFFAWGWLVQARPEQLAHYRDRAWLALAIAPVLLAPVIVTLYRGVTPPLYAIAASGLFTIAMMVFFLGACVRYLATPPAAVRAVSDSAYWMYVVHLPLVVALQIVAAPLAIPGLVKYLAILGVTLAICLASYDVVVRRLWNVSRSSAAHRYSSR